MKPTDLADATARALDLLPPGDPAASDPRQRRDPRLAAEARDTREAAAEVWLAVSPLRVAPPEVLHAVMAEIDPPLSSNRKPRHYPAWLAAGGWAAAAAIAIALWPEPAVTVPPKPTELAERVQGPREKTPVPAPARFPASRDERLREEIGRLKERLTALDDPARRTPRVMSLSAPGAIRRTPEEARRRIQSILTNALRSTIEAASGAPSDPASLVIERGWLPGGLPLPDNGGVIRHRNFPERAWQELGLSRSADGEYYDASNKTIWSADPEGRGFLGRKIAGEEELTRFTADPDVEGVLIRPPVTPEGFIVENPEDGSSQVFIENVPAVAGDRQLIVRVTDDAGTTTEIPLVQAVTPPVGTELTAPLLAGSTSWDGNFSVHGFVLTPGTRYQTTSVTGKGATTAENATPAVQNDSDIVGYFNGGSVILNFPTGTLPSGFQLVDGSLVPDGQPDRIIVEGGP